MTSTSHKFIFVHVPKTGGNSIQNIIRHYSEDKIDTASGQDGITDFEVRNAHYKMEKHSPLSYYRSVLGPDFFQQAFKFATLRNPWERMISFFFSPHRGGRDWNRWDFTQILKQNFPLRHFICLSPRSGLTDDIDFLMRFETLEADFRKVCDKIGVRQAFLPHVNRSQNTKRHHYSHYYDDELKSIVYEMFKEEIEFAGYKFEKP